MAILNFHSTFPEHLSQAQGKEMHFGPKTGDEQFL